MFRNPEGSISFKDLLGENFIDRLEKAEQLAMQQRLKDLNENKGDLEGRIKTLDEQLKLLENNRDMLNISKTDNGIYYPKEVIEDNIRRSRIKEIKVNKEQLEQKVKNLDGAIHILIQDEEVLKIKKKINVKSYLENFEKEKLNAENLAKKWERERNIRLEKLMTLKERNEEKIKEEKLRKEQEAKNKEQKKKEDMNKHIKNIHEKHEQSLARMNSVKLIGSLSKSSSSKDMYTYVKLEKQFKENEEKLQEEKKQLAKEKLQKRKQLFLKPIDFQQISEFQKNHDIKLEELKMKKSRERIEQLHKIQVANSHLQNTESQSYKNSQKEFEELFNKKKTVKQEKDVNYLKVKNFGKIIKENMIPSINEFKKQEREAKFIKKKYEFKKKEKNPYHKYVVKLKKKSHLLNISNSNTSYIDSEGRPHTARSKNRKKFFLDHYDITNNRPLSVRSENEDSLIPPNKTKLKIRRKSMSSLRKLPQKRIPLDKPLDYLKELKQDRFIKNTSAISLKLEDEDHIGTKSECRN